MNSASHSPHPNPSAAMMVPSFPIRALHLITLSSFAVTQPLFDILTRHAEFFSIRRSQPIDLFALVFVLIVVVPLPFVALTGIGGWFGERSRRDIQATLVGLLLAAVLMPPLANASGLGGSVILCIALVLGALAAVFYARFSMVRGLLSFVSVALVAFPVLFLLDPAIRKTAFPPIPVIVPQTEVHSDIPVVLIVFDELPTSSLLDAKGRIDAEMFPNFAELAEGSVWFRNATTIVPLTELAIPAILTGGYPMRGLHPTFQDHPLNLFSLLERAYQIDSVETLSSLNPNDRSEVPATGERIRSLLADLRVIYLHLWLPKDWTGHLPPISQSWKNFALSEYAEAESRRGPAKLTRVEIFHEFVERLDSSPRSLWFLHVLLPHGPHNIYPSGRSYTNKSIQPSRENIKNGLWSEDDWAVAQAYQRHLLQLTLVDNLIGRLISRLRATGLWDNAVIVVTADHGISFRAGDNRRATTDTNLADILFVPMFVRAPGLEAPGVSSAMVQTTDILPTIAELLNIQLQWEVEGKSVFDPSIEQRTEITVLRTGATKYETIAAEIISDAQQETVKRKLAWFGKTGPERLFELGPYGDLVGRRLETFPPPGPQMVKGRINKPRRFQRLSLDARVIPGEIVGMVEQQPGAESLWIVIAINGVICAVTRTYERDSNRNEALWAAVVSESSFRAGRNNVELFTLNKGSSGQVQLHKVAISESQADFRGIVLGTNHVWGVHDSGFYDPGPGSSLRWTNGTGKLIVPVDRHDPPKKLTVKLVNWGPIEQSGLTIRVNGITLYSGPVSGGRWSKTVSLGSIKPSARLKIELLSGTRRPMDVIPGSNDRREMGVQVSGVTLY